MKDRGRVSGAIAILIVGGFLAFCIYCGTKPLPQANHDILNIVAGALIASFTSVTNYFFGSSKSAERAQATIAAVTPAAQLSAADAEAKKS